MRINLDVLYDWKDGFMGTVPEFAMWMRICCLGFVVDSERDVVLMFMCDRRHGVAAS